MTRACLLASGRSASLSRTGYVESGGNVAKLILTGTIPSSALCSSGVYLPAILPAFRALGMSPLALANRLLARCGRRSGSRTPRLLRNPTRSRCARCTRN